MSNTVFLRELLEYIFAFLCVFSLWLNTLNGKGQGHRECAIFLISLLSYLVLSSVFLYLSVPIIASSDLMLQMGMLLWSNIKHNILIASSCIKNLSQSSWLWFFIGRANSSTAGESCFSPERSESEKKRGCEYCAEKHTVLHSRTNQKQ